MLPWKRNKFELLDEAPRAAAAPAKAKAKGYAAGLRCSALTSLAKACPEGALARVGGMFRSKRKTLQISREAPTYRVLYLGNASTLQARGDGCTEPAVAKIWARSEAGKQGTRMKLTLGAQGIRLVPAAEPAPPRPGHLYLLHRVTHGAADPRLPRVFAWVYRHELKHKAVTLRCHAVLAPRAAQAQALARLLHQTSAAALAEFKRLKRRDDARHQLPRPEGRAPPPLPPPRRLLLHGPGCYKPPVERSRSAPKLGAITEDPLGEQREQQGERRRRPDGRDEDGPDPDGRDEEEDDDDELALALPLDGYADTDSDSDAGADADGDSDSDSHGASPPPSLGGGPLPDPPGLARLLGELSELSLGGDVRGLRNKLRVTRLLSGESTGSESSVDSICPDSGGAPGLANGLEDEGPESGPG